MNGSKVWSWVRDVIVWILSLLGNIGLWFSELGKWLFNLSPTLDILIKVLTTLILLAYTLKIYVGIRFPILNAIFDKFKKIFGLKETKLMTISIAESEGQLVEEKMRTSKALIIYTYFFIRYVFKKGRDFMKKVFEKIGKFFKWVFVYNKYSMLGILALLISAIAVFYRITKPELIAKYLGDKELWSAIGGLLFYTSFTVGQKGFESEAVYLARREDLTKFKEEEKVQKDELKKVLRENALVNKAIKPILKEIESVIVNGLLERRENQKVYGVLNNYVNLNKGIPELTAEYIKTLLGDDVYAILLEKLDELAQDYGLVEEIKNVRGEVSYVNLVVEELQKK